MAQKTKKKATGRGPSPNARLVGEMVVEKIKKREPIIMKELMLAAGFSESYSTHPEKITVQPGFIEVMEAAGITDYRAARTHDDLFQAAKIEKFYFDDVTVKKTGKGKKQKVKVLPSISDEEIKKIVEAVPGCKVLYINRLRSKIGTIEVVYSAPEYLTRKAALELAYKVKGQIKPDKHLHAHAHLHNHQYELPPERKEAIDAIIKENK